MLSQKEKFQRTENSETKSRISETVKLNTIYGDALNPNNLGDTVQPQIKEMTEMLMKWSVIKAT